MPNSDRRAELMFQALRNDDRGRIARGLSGALSSDMSQCGATACTLAFVRRLIGRACWL